MTDFTFSADVNRDSLVDALRENEEQLVYVLGRIGNEVSIGDVEDYVHSIECGSDTDKIAAFFRQFADLIEAT